jgi:hypothetical protein
LPQRIGSLFDLVEEQDGKLQPVGMPLVERFLREQGMSLAVAEVSGR